MSQSRTVSLFRNGRNQAVRIPVEFELPGDEAVMRKEGDVLIIEAKRPAKRSLRELLRNWEPEPDFPDVDDGDLPQLRDVELE